VQNSVLKRNVLNNSVFTLSIEYGSLGLVVDKESVPHPCVSKDRLIL